jgi:hypothetical protein
MKPRKDSADSGAGSGCMARLVRLFRSSADVAEVSRSVSSPEVSNRLSLSGIRLGLIKRWPLQYAKYRRLHRLCLADRCKYIRLRLAYLRQVLIAHRSMLLVFFHCGWDRGCALYKELGGFWFRPNSQGEAQPPAKNL